MIDVDWTEVGDDLDLDTVSNIHFKKYIRVDIKSRFPPRLENLEKWESIFQPGKKYGKRLN